MFASIFELFKKFEPCQTDPIDSNIVKTISLLSRFPVSHARPHFETFLNAAFRRVPIPESSHLDPCSVFKKFKRFLPHFSLTNLQSIVALPAWPRIAAGLANHHSSTRALIAAISPHADDPIIRPILPAILGSIDLSQLPGDLAPSVTALVSLSVSNLSRDRIESLLEFLDGAFDRPASFVLGCSLLTVLAAEQSIRSRFCGFVQMAIQAVDCAARSPASGVFSQHLPALCRSAVALAAVLPARDALLDHARAAVFERRDYSFLVPLIALDAVFGDRLLEDLRGANVWRNVDFAVSQLAWVADVGGWAESALPALAGEFESGACGVAGRVLDGMGLTKAAEWVAAEVKAGRTGFARNAVRTMRDIGEDELKAAVTKSAGEEVAALIWEVELEEEEEEHNT
jgi:hypothetical protein